jgi:hypothetical protein
MKANAPEKIYLQEPTKVRTEKKYDNDVEYARTDAFIEKACEYWYKYNRDVVSGFTVNVEDFRKYMKGE